MYFNYTKYIPIVFQLQNTNYLCQCHKIQNTLNVFQLLVLQLLALITPTLALGHLTFMDEDKE